MDFPWECFYLTAFLGLNMQKITSNSKNMVIALAEAFAEHMTISAWHDRIRQHFQRGSHGRLGLSPIPLTENSLQRRILSAIAFSLHCIFYDIKLMSTFCPVSKINMPACLENGV